MARLSIGVAVAYGKMSNKLFFLIAPISIKELINRALEVWAQQRPRLSFELDRWTATRRIDKLIQVVGVAVVNPVLVVLAFHILDPCQPCLSIAVHDSKSIGNRH